MRLLDFDSHSLRQLTSAHFNTGPVTKIPGWGHARITWAVVCRSEFSFSVFGLAVMAGQCCVGAAQKGEPDTVVNVPHFWPFEIQQFEGEARQ